MVSVPDTSCRLAQRLKSLGIGIFNVAKATTVSSGSGCQPSSFANGKPCAASELRPHRCGAMEHATIGGPEAPAGFPQHVPLGGAVQRRRRCPRQAGLMARGSLRPKPRSAVLPSERESSLVEIPFLHVCILCSFPADSDARLSDIAFIASCASCNSACVRSNEKVALRQ
jgi:hypothetical protein